MKKKIDTDLCVICFAHGNDKRFLRIRCFYAVDEVVSELKFNKGFYEGWICKACRGALLGAMKEWRDKRVALRDTPKDHDGNVLEEDWTRNIPVRVNGAIIMMNEEEFANYKQHA